MNDSLKVAIVAGLIAGFVLGVAYEFFDQVAASWRLFEPWWIPINTGNMIINIPIFGLWGIIFAVIYSKAYNVIPQEGVLKGLIYGLFLWIIISIRYITFDLAYGNPIGVVGVIFAGFFQCLLFGLVLGILYDELLFDGQLSIKEKVKTYDLRSGILPGALAGLIGGIAASVVAIAGPALGLWKLYGFTIESSFDLWLSQLGAHTVINLFWGAIFGAIFAKAYSSVPGKKIIKGLYYGLIIYLITSFHLSSFSICWAVYHNAWVIAEFMVGNIIIAAAQFIVFGIVLGLLYKKSGD
jgi:hypothetical protein